MPELPEVETIRRQLLPYLPFTIKKIETSVHFPSLLKRDECSIVNHVIKRIERRGKMLIFHLDGGNYLLSQLGMSGSWRILVEKVRGKETKAKHTHLTLISQQKKILTYLTYVDPRRFGRIQLVGEKSYRKIMAQAGMDVSSPDFTSDYIYQQILRYPNRPVKSSLLDQKFFAGVGNYLANEICARAFILPTRLCKSLNFEDCQRMVKATQTILQGAIQLKGTTFHGGYTDAHGEKGYGVTNLMVFYQQTCRLCQVTPVQKIILNGRGTYFCSHCQK